MTTWANPDIKLLTHNMSCSKYLPCTCKFAVQKNTLKKEAIILRFVKLSCITLDNLFILSGNGAVQCSYKMGHFKHLTVTMTIKGQEYDLEILPPSIILIKYLLPFIRPKSDSDSD